MKSYEVNIKLKRNRQVTLYLSPHKDEDIFVDEKANGVPFQLIEGKRYYFELSDVDFYIDGDPQIIKCYPSRSGVSNGEITTGNFVGTFSADIKAKENDETQGKIVLEIVRNGAVGVFPPLSELFLASIWVAACLRLGCLLPLGRGGTIILLGRMVGAWGGMMCGVHIILYDFRLFGFFFVRVDM